MVKMRAFYGKLSACLVFWLLFSQTLGVLAEQADTDLQQEDNVDDDEEGAEGRSFSDFFKYMSSPDENVGSARLNNKPGIFNTTVAFTVPLFSFSLPDRKTSGTSYTKEAALALVGLAIVAGLAIIPYVWAIQRSGVIGTGRSLSESNNADVSTTASILGAISDLASRSGLDPQQCFLRTVCEANQQPKKYGSLSLPLRFLFRASKARRGEKLSVYQEAALYGTESQDSCYEKYFCSFSMLEAVGFLMHYFTTSA